MAKEFQQQAFPNDPSCASCKFLQVTYFSEMKVGMYFDF